LCSFLYAVRHLPVCREKVKRNRADRCAPGVLRTGLGRFAPGIVRFAPGLSLRSGLCHEGSSKLKKVE
jgi:hypothetical protein